MDQAVRWFPGGGPGVLPRGNGGGLRRPWGPRGPAGEAVVTGEGRGPRVFWHPGTLTEKDRAQKLGQTGCVVWFTGL